VTRRRNRKTEPVEQGSAITIADYYRMKLTQPNPTQPTYEEYRLNVTVEGHNWGMAESPAFRTGYMTLLLPSSTGDLMVRSTIRNMVIDALAATGEWPARVHVVTSKLEDDGDMKRWFVEYETGPVGEAVELPDAFEWSQRAIGAYHQTTFDFGHASAACSSHDVGEKTNGVRA
jgi:hypothetical protein